MIDGYRVARCDQTVYVVVVGLANMKNAPILDAFLREEWAQGARTACVDLGSCRGMDSTFMGTLVGHHMRMADDGGKIVVVNPTPGNERLLQMLGVSQVLPVVHQELATGLRFIDLEAQGSVSPLKRAEMMRDAHEHLVAISEQNRSKFGAFLDALERDLARLRAKDAPADD